MGFKLKQLLKGIEGIEVRGSKEIEVTGIASDSRIVAPGNVFIAKRGAVHDGAQYIAQAVNAGARAIVTDVYDPFLNLSQIITKHPEKTEAKLAANYYGHPSKKLFVVGVTGSKGKTSTTYLVRHVLEGFGEKCGLLGTIEAFGRFEGNSTTRGCIANQKLLKEMVLENCKSAVLEVSSHGLSQGRVDEIDFDVGIFTNLYPDHLDYHKTVEDYARAKKRLFTDLKGHAIFNADSSWSSFMRGDKKGFFVGIQEEADLQAKDVSLTAEGITFTVDGVRFSSNLMGIFNVYNMLGAIGVGVLKGHNLKEISSVLESFEGVPGRLQRVQNDKGIHVFVDYAHTGESLAHALTTLRRIAKGKMILVFGCGGNRDVARRKEMAEAAEKYADLSIVTTDNSRSEDPHVICRHILEGFSAQEKVIVDLDRKSAIERAICQAKRGDLVLIAGKGHEKVQIFANQTVPFDDVEVAKEIFAQIAGNTKYEKITG